MQHITAVIAFVLASSYALPQDEAMFNGGDQRIVTGNIQRAVEEMNQRLRDAGLDPFHIDHWSTRIVTPNGGINTWITGLRCSGISRNRFDRLDYSILTSRLRVDFVWDRIACEIESAGLQVTLLGYELSFLKSGILEIIQLRVRGDLRFTFRPIEGVSLRDCVLDLTAEIKSDLKVKMQGRDLSDQVNGAVATLNELLRANRDAIGKQLCELAGSFLKTL